MKLAETTQRLIEMLFLAFQKAGNALDTLDDSEQLRLDFSYSFFDLTHRMTLVSALISWDVPWIAHSGQIFARHVKQ